MCLEITCALHLPQLFFSGLQPPTARGLRFHLSFANPPTPTPHFPLQYLCTSFVTILVMSGNVELLEPQIRDILTAPGIDLKTISAKRVRQQLLDQDPSLTADFLKENKDEVDELITNVYEQISSEAGQAEEAEDEAVREEGEEEEEEEEEEAPVTKGKRRRKVEDDGEDEAEEAPSRPAKTKKARKTNGTMTDEEMARQLSDEINGRSRSSRTSSTRGTRGRGGGKRGGKRGAKSAATVDSDGEEGEGEATKKKSKRGTGFQKEYALSEPLVAVLNVEKLSRPQVVKQLWDYIKGNGLQNPAAKKEILCDDKLKALFNVDRIDMFRMNKVLGQ
ncbi:uncharacterized protein FIBRA_01207 [Fibroporia radiculosa]|uniref:Uncharacterized protein n=1 Tax=Fibroporia radiculosa TaxID=599839 RepID=J4HSY0_9APHY|nr:uncharacterized protein FIBRA_01207 [Fibroporia radiculosa]CCL99192.1 predicted protein [Fibroporia radiculosa]